MTRYKKKLVNKYRGWDEYEQKVVLYAYTHSDGSVYRANGYCVGNHIAGDFSLQIPEDRGYNSAREYWKDFFGEYPQNDQEKVAVSMMEIYSRYVKDELTKTYPKNNMD